MNKRKLIEQCELTLKQNDLGNWTRPAPGLYPNQWLWDSCFIAIGLRHSDVRRAQIEINSLLRGQWENGMIPHIIQSPDDYYGNKLWGKKRSPLQPENIVTSTITQPPLIAEAMVKVGEKLSTTKRLEWYRHHINELLAYHEWLYRERDPDKNGLIALLHPWESGIDNSPAWMSVIHKKHIPYWVQTLDVLGFDSLLDMLRRDTKLVPAGERISSVYGLLLYHHIKKVLRFRGESQKALKHSRIAMEDVLFNSILVRANQCLQQIADEIDVEVPSWLLERMKQSESALELMFDKKHHVYFDRNYHTGRLIHVESIGRYMPLYSGAISQKRARELASQIKKELNATHYPVASTPVDSPYFNHHRYWQGPSWVNTNWLIIEGLNRYGFHELADEITSRTLQLVNQYGPHEYFSPLDGTPAGAHQFSWSAALAIDLSAN